MSSVAYALAVEGGDFLVVGGAGFVGSNLVRSLLDMGAQRVRVIDNLLSAERANLPDSDRLEFIEGSIADDAILANLKDAYDAIFHLATYHGNQSSIANPLADHENNLITNLKLFEHVKDFVNLKRLVYTSTGCALAEKGDVDAKAVSEDGSISIDMDSPYQISKVVGEMHAVYYHRLYQLPVVRVRFQNIYGPGEILGAGEWRGTPATIWRNVTPSFIYRALKGQPLILFGDGSSTRDFIFVADIVAGLIQAATVAGVEGDVFNLASGEEITIGLLAETINRLTENPTPVTYKPQRGWDRSIHRFGSTEKSRHKLDFNAQVGLQQGLEQTVAWTKAHLDLIDSCVNRHLDKLTGGLFD
jgi:nucleoside-diphosphate-sugar epimerase